MYHNLFTPLNSRPTTQQRGDVSHCCFIVGTLSCSLGYTLLPNCTIYISISINILYIYQYIIYSINISHIYQYIIIISINISYIYQYIIYIYIYISIKSYSVMSLNVYIIKLIMVLYTALYHWKVYRVRSWIAYHNVLLECRTKCRFEAIDSLIYLCCN